jgi:histidinol-phosphate/aromatic aminotransferase/cobyric acid decarboxylase-like protein
VAAPLLKDDRWQRRVQRWVAKEGAWFFKELQGLGGLTPFPSAANYLLVRGEQPLLALQEQLEQRRILVRDCRSFVGLDGHWLRLALLDRRRNQTLLSALKGALTSSHR